nr:EAL domain-containing protein [uncultured Aminipila sp.]
MVLKVAERFYLTLEVDIDSMTVILIKDGKEGRTYDANQYFQYFVEYGVRKVDVVQLQEHFSLDYFQNMLVTGKNNETFEFCVQFVGEDYKILKCKIKLLESQNSNIIKILLEDISHKRVQQLVYIKNHFEQHNQRSYAKPFDIKFEEEKNNNIKKQKNYKYAIIVTLILCIIMSIIFFQDIYSKNINKAAEETLNSCKIINQCITQQLDCISHNQKTFKNLISNRGRGLTKSQLIDYVEEEEREYGYEAMAFVDEKQQILYTDDPMEFSNIPYIENSFDYKTEESFFVTGDYLDGSALINYIAPVEGLTIDRVKYKQIVTIFDLDEVCYPVFINGNFSNYDSMIINAEGDILWGESSEISKLINHQNFFDYLNKGYVKIKFEDRVEALSKNLEQKESGTFNFSVDGKRKFVAYTPLGIQDLYLISISKAKGISMSGINLLILSIITWVTVLILPIMLLLYQKRRIKEEKDHLENIAYSDAVTGGMNSNYFDKKAKNIISEMECHYALVATNMHNFNLYNSKYGNIRGNGLIRRLFLGISRYIDNDELVCRDYAERMMILMKYEGENQLEDRLLRIGKGIIDVNLKLEFGVCIIRDLTMDLKVAKERAGMALRNESQKQKDNITISYYDVKLLEKVLFEKKLENTMYRAFRNGEFKIYVEPRYDLKTRALCNGDVYAVWEHPEKGALVPEQYVGVFERRGLSMCLDSFIFEEICKKIKEHLDKEKTCMHISIKLHRNHFNVADFINKLKRIKERYGIQGECFSFEISEEILQEKIYQIDKIIRCIHEMGANCIIGECSGRYLSLELLSKIQIDAIKFDSKLLIESLPNEMIVALIKVAKGAKAKAIFTGVSKQSQISYLAQNDCDEAKGDAFAKNISLDEYINIF